MTVADPVWNHQQDHFEYLTHVLCVRYLLKCTLSSRVFFSLIGIFQKIVFLYAKMFNN